jgi:hypothetical protein
MESRNNSISTQSTSTPASTSASSIDISMTHSDLFNVAGLTRTLLEACIRAYFDDVQPCRPVLHPEDFFKSYEAFWQPLEHLKMDVTACHSILIVAVACLGAGQLSAPISESGSLAKFNLRDRLHTRYQEMIDSTDWSYWYRRKDACDIVEAAYIMSEFSVGSLDEEQEALGVDEMLGRSTQSTCGGPIWRISAPRVIDGVRSVPVPRNTSIFNINPCSHQFAVQLALRLGVNRRCKRRLDCPQGDERTLIDVNQISITPKENFRRIRVFWSLFMMDTFRSFSKRLSPLIGDDDYDQDLPRWTKRPEAKAVISNSNTDGKGLLKDYSLYQPSSVEASDPKPGTLTMQPTRFIKFDGLLIENMLRLVFLIRSLSLHFVSIRSQSKGIWTRDIIRAIKALRSWKKQKPQEISWDTHSQDLLHNSLRSKSTFQNHRNAKRTLVHEFLYHSLIMGIWASVEDFGIRTGSLQPTEAASLLLERFDLESKVVNLLDQASQSEEVKHQLHEFINESFIRMAKVVKEAGQLGFLRCSRSQMMGVTAAYALYGCRTLVKKCNTKAVVLDISSIMSCTKDLIEALRSIDSWIDAVPIADQLDRIVQDIQVQSSSMLFDYTFHLPPLVPAFLPFQQANVGGAKEELCTMSLNATATFTQMDDWLATFLSQEMLSCQDFAFDSGVYQLDQLQQDHSCADHYQDQSAKPAFNILPSIDDINLWVQSNVDMDQTAMYGST